MHSTAWLALALLAAGDPETGVPKHYPWRGTGAHTHSSIGKGVRISDLPDIVRPTGPAPTTAELASRHDPGPDRPLPGGLRITTRCEGNCCVDGLMAGDEVLLAPQVDRDLRDHCAEGFVERVVRAAYQDESAVSIYVAESWYFAGAAHAHNRLRCRTFDIATRKPLALRDVVPGAAATRALAHARWMVRNVPTLRGYAPDAKGIRFGSGNQGRRDVEFCAEGSGDIAEMPAAL